MIYKKSFGLLAAVAVVAAAGCCYQQNKQYDGLSELAPANVEALARNEGSSDCQNFGPNSGYMCIINYTNGTSTSCPGRWK